MFGGLKYPAGLDLGSSAVKAVQLRGAGRNCRAVAAAIEPLPPGAIADGLVVDTAAVSEAVRRCCAQKAFARHVCVALPGIAAVVRRITIPPVPEPEREDAIRWEAAQHIPFDLDDMHLDFQLLPARRGEDAGAIQVLVAAAKQETVSACTASVTRCGRVPVVVDLNAFACQNAYEANYDIGPDEVVALLDVGATAVGITVLHGGQMVFTRDIPMGGRTYLEALQRDAGLSTEAAERAMRGLVCHAPADRLTSILRAVTDTILLEVAKTLGFLRTTAFSEDVGRMVLTGGASRTPGFQARAEERLGKPVDLLDPFRSIAWDVTSPALPREDAASLLAVAVGLALRQPGDGAEGRQ